MYYMSNKKKEYIKVKNKFIFIDSLILSRKVVKTLFRKQTSKRIVEIFLLLCDHVDFFHTCYKSST